MLAVMTISFLLVTCRKDPKICTKETELTDRNHLVDITVLSSQPEFANALANPQLQVYKIINDEYIYGMHCNVFYNDLRVFTDYYRLFKNKTTGLVYHMDSIVDTMYISLQPTLSYDKAINKARKEFKFKTCISYRPGIYNLNAGTSNQPANYKLVWKVQGDSGYPYVILDAHTAEVYAKFDGIEY